MTLTRLFFLTSFVFLTTYLTTNGQLSGLEKQIQKTIRLNYGFEIKVGQKDSFKIFETYTLFILTRNGKTIYLDTSLTEYEFGDTLYPIITKIDNDTFEILIEVNDRPNKNYLKRLQLKNDQLITTDQLPTFISTAKNLDGDNNLEYAGFWDFSQIWGEGNQLTAYNPIIYYEITPNGLQLDSSLTIDRNKFIYGEYKGFNFNENFEMPVTIDENFEKEMERIIKAK